MASLSHQQNYYRAVSKFFVQYSNSNTQLGYDTLVAATKSECEKILHDLSIKGVVSGRTKALESLQNKFVQMADDDHFNTWAATASDITDHPEMGDLAAVRFGLYLPEGIVKVAREVEKRFRIIHPFGTVTGGRDVDQGRNLDIDRHENGPWYTQDSDGTEEHWEHSGYRSWQMVVEWINPPSDLVKLQDPPWGVLSSLKVEIQIGTVVSQAWAEVQHNIIYKKSTNILATPSMKRIIDAINGLAITTDIMLRELERSLEVETRREASEKAKRPFESVEEMIEWFKTTYLRQMRPDESELWQSDLVETNRWSSAAQLMHICSEEGYLGVTPCRETFEGLIEEHRLLDEGVVLQRYDIWVLLFRAIIQGRSDLDHLLVGFAYP
ncbi:hypothetical protein HBH42_139080 [Parastagonospora nodorum]|nr:hypothetical protein HBH42_139080 [Parastagonospora nodorum]